jgi:hypothetical protein
MNLIKDLTLPLINDFFSKKVGGKQFYSPPTVISTYPDTSLRGGTTKQSSD